MQVKVYEAQDMRTAIEKVKKDLGPEALILSSRSISTKSGGAGKPWIEVTAAVDNSSEPVKKVYDGKNGRMNRLVSGEKPAPNASRSETYAKDGNFERILEQTRQAPVIGGKRADTETLFDEIRSMKQSFQELAREISGIRGDGSNLFSADTGYQSENNGADNAENSILKALDGLGLAPDVRRSLIEVIDQKKSCSQSKGRIPLDCTAEEAVAELVRIDDPLSRPWTGQKRLSFIGPTGVGKTTTIAKVAASYLLNCGPNIALATIDNYRIAAVEQLKIYGRIMNIPVETAQSPQELENIFQRNRDKDLILVDTAGRSPKDELSIKELSAFLDPSLQIENQLVLSVTTRESDLYNVIRRFQALELSGLVFTKLDESDQLGSILNVPAIANRPITFLTNGQKVPEDLLPPEPLQIAKLMLPKKETVEKWNTEENLTRPKRCVH